MFKHTNKQTVSYQKRNKQHIEKRKKKKKEKKRKKELGTKTKKEYTIIKTIQSFKKHLNSSIILLYYNNII